MSTRGAQQAESGQVWQGGRGLGVTLMVTRRWRRAVALAASVLLAGEAFLGASSAMTAAAAGAPDRVVAIPAASTAAEDRGVAIATASRAMATAPGSQPHRQQRQLPEAGFDGILVAAIGAGLTGAGWLLMLTGSRRLRRRSR